MSLKCLNEKQSNIIYSEVRLCNNVGISVGCIDLLLATQRKKRTLDGKYIELNNIFSIYNCLKEDYELQQGI